MNESKLNRRDVCKCLLALGGMAIGLKANGQTPTPVITPLQTGDALQDQKIADAVKGGATMEEIAELRDPIAQTPQEALHALKNGKRPIFRRSGASPRTFRRRTPRPNSGANAVRGHSRLFR